MPINVSPLQKAKYSIKGHSRNDFGYFWQGLDAGERAFTGICIDTSVLNSTIVKSDGRTVPMFVYF